MQVAGRQEELRTKGKDRWLTLVRHPEKRDSVVREIVTTERNYIRILQAVLDLYQGPLEAKARAKKKWISEDQVKAIFYQIKGSLLPFSSWNLHLTYVTRAHTYGQ